MAERREVLREVDRSLRMQTAILTELSEREDDVGVAEQMARTARCLDDERRTLSEAHRFDDWLAAAPSQTPLLPEPIGTIRRADGAGPSEEGPVADGTHEVRRRCSALFEGCQRLEYQAEALTRLAASASADLPAEMRALLLRRRDHIRRERDGLAQRMAVLAQYMATAQAHANARMAQREWLLASEQASPEPPGSTGSANTSAVPTPAAKAPAAKAAATTDAAPAPSTKQASEVRGRASKATESKASRLGAAASRLARTTSFAPRLAGRGGGKSTKEPR